ncbi:MAG: lipid-A-disaccharide synthase [Desulfobacterales bacterium]|nr:lipid-A-disaccharide synthase [Desulfobacterales bacterium]
MKRKRVMIIAGEASGDLHGARLIQAMQRKNSALAFCGIGGKNFKAAGVKILYAASLLAVVGITEVFSKLSNLCRAMAVAKKALERLRPDLLILIDFPDFNLHVAAKAKSLKIPVFYYISPQLWAWRSGRVRKIRKRVDHVAVILPFEEAFYRQNGIPVTFVGHPLLDSYRSPAGATSVKKDDGAHVIGLLPGSREKEIAKLLPVMLEAARILLNRLQNVHFIISIAPDVARKHVEDLIIRYGLDEHIEIADGGVGKVLARTRLAVAASGTVTLEAAISGTPVVVIYRVSPITYWLGRALVKVKHISLVNLIAGRQIVPELLQGRASPENIADTVLTLSGDAAGLEKLRESLLDIRNRLGGEGASERAADIALRFL